MDVYRRELLDFVCRMVYWVIDFVVIFFRVREIILMRLGRVDGVDSIRVVILN